MTCQFNLLMKCENHFSKNKIFSDMEKAGFSKDVCRSMIAMMDWDRSGKLGFEEFKSLWIDIRQWKVITNDQEIEMVEPEFLSNKIFVLFL